MTIKPERLSIHADPDNFEAVAFDSMIEQGYCLDVFDHDRSVRDYIMRIRGKIKGTAAADRHTSTATGHELPMIWYINAGDHEQVWWCSRRPVEHLFLQIRLELGFMDENPTLDRQAGSVGPKFLSFAGDSLSFRSSNWSGLISDEPRQRADRAELERAVAAGQRRLNLLDNWDAVPVQGPYGGNPR